jgi:hypothetical protein
VPKTKKIINQSEKTNQINQSLDLMTNKLALNNLKTNTQIQKETKIVEEKKKEIDPPLEERKILKLFSFLRFR